MGRRDFSNRGKHDFNLANADADIMGEFSNLRGERSVALADLIVSKEVQVRVGGLDEENVERLFAVKQNGGELPPIIAYETERGLFVADGFHRMEVYKRLGETSIRAEIRKGTFEEALNFAEEANLKHGKMLSAADKKNLLIRRLARGHEWTNTSNREIGRQLGVDHKTISNWINRYNSTGENSPVKRNQVTGGDGRSYDTSNIRRANEERKAEIKPVSDEALKPRTEAQAKNQIAYLKGEIDYTMMLIEQQQRKGQPDKQYLADLNKRLSRLQNRRDAIAETLPTMPGTVKQVSVDWSGETPVVSEMTSVDKARGIIVNMGGLLDKLSEVLRRDGDEWTTDEWNAVSSDFQRFLDRCQALVTEE